MSIIVYAQPTNWNERLCSLLSSVLQRSMRPSFTHAILEKPRRLRTPNNNNNWNPHRTSSTSNSSRRRSRTEPSSPKIVKIVCVGTLPSERIVSMIPDFRLRYRLKVCVLSSREEQTIQSSLTRLCTGSDPVVLVAFSPSALYSVYSFLCRFMNSSIFVPGRPMTTTTTTVCGVLSIAAPTIVHDDKDHDRGRHNDGNPIRWWWWMTIPLLVVLNSRPNNLHSHYLTNPNTIVVQNDSLSYSNDKKHDKEYLTQAVWIARTIAKYAEAVVAMTEQQTQQPKEEQLNDFAFGPSLAACL